MRVATRRLRSTLRSFGQIIGRDRTQRLAIELKWLGTVLGDARDPRRRRSMRRGWRCP
jgi:CHAD domain-containing protein